MESINFNTGVKRYAVNGDENNVISINVSDINLYKRIMDAKGAFEPIVSRLDHEENTPELYYQVDREIKEKLDFVFETDISSHAFGDVNCLSELEDGSLLFMSFFEAFAPMVVKDINAAKEGFAQNQEERFKKYLPAEEPNNQNSQKTYDLTKLSPEQIAYLESLKQ